MPSDGGSRGSSDHSKFTDAPKNSKWYKAIQHTNCAELMLLLQPLMDWVEIMQSFTYDSFMLRRKQGLFWQYVNGSSEHLQDNLENLFNSPELIMASLKDKPELKNGSIELIIQHMKKSLEDQQRLKYPPELTSSLNDMDLDLTSDPRLLLEQTGWGGRTVLHTAVVGCCGKLVDHVLLVFDREPVHEGLDDLITLQDLLWAEDGLCHETALAMALVVGKQDIIVSLKKALLSRESTLGNPRDGTADTTASETTHDETLRNIQQNVLLELSDFKRRSLSMLDDGNRQGEMKDDLYTFHILCSSTSRLNPARDVLQDIVEKCKDEPSSVLLLQRLFKLQDDFGRTPLHITINSWLFCEVLKLIPPGDDYKECVNGLDHLGRTPLHLAAASGALDALQSLVKDGRTVLDQIFSPLTHDEGLRDIMEDKNKKYEATALHLAIMNNRYECLKLLWDTYWVTPPIDPNKLWMTRSMKFGSKDYMESEEWTPLQLAAITGHRKILELLLKDDRAYDGGRNSRLSALALIEFTELAASKKCFLALHLLAARGNIEGVKLMLDSSASEMFRFNPLQRGSAACRGCTALHLAADVFSMNEDLRCIFDFSRFWELQKTRKAFEKQQADKGYSGKKECINLLLHAGLDISERDYELSTPDPGLLASDEARAWWYGTVNKVTKDIKSNLNSAANALSVTATLVATASYVGPMQPPLGYATYDAVISLDDENVLVKIFIFFDSLSFYLAVACIMLALIPSLPLEQERWWHTQMIVHVAICVLLTSIMCILVAFAAASIAVLPTWNRRALTLSTAMIGGVSCLVVMIILVKRVLKLIKGYRKFAGRSH